jgi:hypothetical protein
MQTSRVSANCRFATISQCERFASGIAFQPTTHDNRLRESEVMDEGFYDHRQYGYRAVSSRRCYATSAAKIPIEPQPLLSLVNTSVGQMLYPDEYSFIMASRCPVSSEQCEKVRLEISLNQKEVPLEGTKNSVAKGL